MMQFKFKKENRVQFWVSGQLRRLRPSRLMQSTPKLLRSIALPLVLSVAVMTVNMQRSEASHAKSAASGVKAALKGLAIELGLRKSPEQKKQALLHQVKAEKDLVERHQAAAQQSRKDASLKKKEGDFQFAKHHGRSAEISDWHARQAQDRLAAAQGKLQNKYNVPSK